MAQATAVQHDGVPRLVLRGEIDLADYDSLTAALHRLERPGPRILAIDLRHVDYIDSTGLRWLIEANERSRAVGRRLLVIHAKDERVERVFRLCALDEVLDLIEASAPARA
jgi:anti-sigma B factor antagonist